jgi:hypothetical protein
MDRRWDWILIEVDLKDGLVGDKDLFYGYFIWNQKNY